MSRLRRPLALIVLSLVVFVTSGGKMLVGVECHRVAVESHHLAHGHGHGAEGDDTSGHAGHEQGSGNTLCECVGSCHLSSYTASKSDSFEPSHFEVPDERVLPAESPILVSPRYLLPYPNGPPVS